MIRNIIKNTDFLKIPSTTFQKEDLFLIQDLKDTLSFHKAHCVGMAANMIGYSKNCIIFINENNKMEIMIEPKILKAENPYETEEGCLSLEGVRPCLRYKKIKVEYLNESFQKRIKTYTDFTAQIIQHEYDHLLGRII
jgi:peptide deformylase